MAGTSLRVIARTSTDSQDQPHDLAGQASCTTRTRRNHGVFLLSGELLCIYSSRRRYDDMGVCVTIGNGPGDLQAHLTPRQARTLAHAFLSAANAAETTVKGDAE